VSEPIWITRDQVIEIDRLVVEASKEPFSILDNGLLESAIARPQAHYSYGEEDPVFLAVKLLFGIARNHAFQQGNKRTGFLAALAFLHFNGFAYEGPDSETFAEVIIEVIERKTTEDEFFSVFRDCVAPL
jgi:death on curing protein